MRAYDGGDRREVARQGAIAAETARLRKTLDARVETERAAALEDLSQAARAIDVGLARLLADAEQRVLRRNAERLGVLLSETRGVDPETGRQSTVFVVHLHDHPEA